MVKYILKRIGYMVIVIIIVSLLMFFIYNLIPNDPARAELEPIKHELVQKGTYEQRYQELRKSMGLDDPLIVRYGRWIGIVPSNGEFKGILQGYMGYSTMYKKDVTDILVEPMKNTILINIFSVFFALAITIPLGIQCAVKKGTKFDGAVQVGTILGYSIPVFIIAIVFIWVFAVLLKIFPVSGMQTPGANYTGIRWFLDRMYYMLLPLIVMTFSSLGGMTRYVRASMIDALSMDYIRTARAKGLREKVVIYSHAWRNALIPIITIVIGWFLSVFSGSIIIETTFGLNGIGKLYVSSLTNRDFEVVLALQMFYVFIALIGNLIIDLAYGLADPRIRVTN